MSELWALPLLLRLALSERLIHQATGIDDQQHEFEWADFWANRLLLAARRSPDQLLFILAELARDQSHPSTVFADRLIGQLQGESFALGPVFAWLELKWGQPVFEAIQQEDRQHVADQVTIANGISSLRLLARLDWRDVFEQISLVEVVLRAEEANVYGLMDFETRDRYRHVVEEIARRSHLSEVEVARAAVEAASAIGGGYQGHVGYHLIDAGRSQLEARAGDEFDAPPEAPDECFPTPIIPVPRRHCRWDAGSHAGSARACSPTQPEPSAALAPRRAGALGGGTGERSSSPDH